MAAASGFDTAIADLADNPNCLAVPDPGTGVRPAPVAETVAETVAQIVLEQLAAVLHISQRAWH